jgi:outer membrane protein OmpA-like peptidoglycan-associated protein
MKNISIPLLFLFLACSYQIKIKTGDQAYDSKQYAVAQNLYRNEFDQSEDLKIKAYKAFRIGLCYKNVSHFEQALKWFKKAYDLNYGLKALEEYAFALKDNGEYEAAIAAFQELTEELKNTTEFRKEINICKLNMQWKLQKSEFYYKLINWSELNEKSSDYSAVMDTSGVIYFVSDRLQESKSKTSKFAWTGRFFSDIFKFSGNTVSPLPAPVNSADNEGPFCFDSKMKTLYFTRCSNTGESEDYCNIYSSSSTSSGWTEPELMDFGLGVSNQMHPALYKNDSILVLSSDAKNGIGQYDLYISYLRREGWSRAENLGETVNTALDEKFPVWYRDTLFFSSTGHPGMGGLDVFKTYQVENRKWVPPINMKPAINSEADDFGFFVDTSFTRNDSVYLKGLLSSNRAQTDNDEIYSVELRKRAETKQIIPPGKFKWEIVVNIQFVSHEIYKNNTKLKLDSIELIEKVSKNTLNTRGLSNVSLKVLPSDHYTFLASKRNYLNKEFSFNTPDAPVLDHDSTYIINLEVEMLPIRYDQEFILQELYYDFDDWKIRADAVPALEQLRMLLVTNPKIRILLGSHTDCRGDDAYNDILSSKRAQSALNWLVEKGISIQRLEYKGYGERNPSVECKCEECTEAQHQLNRRTTFRIIPN